MRTEPAEEGEEMRKQYGQAGDFVCAKFPPTLLYVPYLTSLPAPYSHKYEKIPGRVVRFHPLHACMHGAAAAAAAADRPVFQGCGGGFFDWVAWFGFSGVFALLG